MKRLERSIKRAKRERVKRTERKLRTTAHKAAVRKQQRKVVKREEVQQRGPLKITEAMLAWSRRPRDPKKLLNGEIHPFVKANHPKSVFPAGWDTMAKDEQIDESLMWAQSAVPSMWEEGLAFLGYPYLSEVAQRAEYRRISEIIATEMTRKWIRFKAKSTEDDKSEKISQLEDEMERLKVRDVFREATELDGFFGRGHIYIDTGDTDNAPELKTTLGDGSGDISKAKVTKGSIKQFKKVEPVWCYPAHYNSNDPLKEDWYKATSWLVMGKELHASRLLTFIGREVPDLLKPAYSFGGLSLSQMMKPYIDNWLRTRQSVSDLIHSFSVFVLSTDFQSLLQEGSDELFKRIDLFNNLRDNRGVMVINKDTEDFKNVSATIGSLDHLQAQSQEQICSVSGIPLVKFTGISPSGLNASSEGEIRAFYDWILAFQKKLYTKNLTKIVHFVMLNIWGEVDEDIVWDYVPLWSLDDKAEADKRKTEMDTDVEAINAGILSPEESRKRIAADPNTPYQGLDVEDIPVPPEGEEGGEGGEGELGEGEPGEGEASEGDPMFGLGKNQATKPARPDAARAHDELHELMSDLRSARDSLMASASRVAMDQGVREPPVFNITMPPISLTIAQDGSSAGSKEVKLVKQPDGSLIGMVTEPPRKFKLEKKDGAVVTTELGTDA